MFKIFISYRRADTHSEAEQIAYRLRSEFGYSAVFFDETSLNAGDHFPSRLFDEIRESDVVLIIAGPNWAGIGPNGNNRIDDPLDYVRQEVLRALSHPHITTIPVLINLSDSSFSRMLPSELYALAERHYLSLKSGSGFDSDLERLVDAVRYRKPLGTRTVAIDRLFVDRKTEVKMLLESAQKVSQSVPGRISKDVIWIHVHAIGGTGKTSLIEEFQERGRQICQGLKFHYVRLPNVRLPNDNTSSLSSVLRDDEYFGSATNLLSDNEVIQWLVRLCINNILIVDNFPTSNSISDKQNSTLDKQFVKVLSSLENANSLVLTTARGVLTGVEQLMPSTLVTRSKSVLLRPFESQDVRELIESFRHRVRLIESDQSSQSINLYDQIYANFESVWRLTSGEPLLLDLLLRNPYIWNSSNDKEKLFQLFESNGFYDLIWEGMENENNIATKAINVLSIVALHSTSWDESLWFSLIGNNWRNISSYLVKKGLVQKTTNLYASFRMHDLIQKYAYLRLGTEAKGLHLEVALFYEKEIHLPNRSDYSVHALQHFIDSGNHEGIMRVFDLGLECLSRMGRYPEILDIREPILQALAKKPSMRAKALLWFGKALRVNDNYELAHATYEKIFALKLSRINLIRAHRGLANTYRVQSQYRDAEEQYIKSLDIAQVARDNRGIAKASFGVARIYRLRGDLTNAFKFYQNAYLAFEKLGNSARSDTAWAAFGLGEVARLRWDLSTSADYYQRSLDIFASLSHQEGQAYAAWGQAEIYRLSNRFESARRDYTKSLNLCIEVGDKRSAGWALLGLAETLRQEGKVSDALQTYSSLSFQFDSNPVEKAHTLLGIAACKRLLSIVPDVELNEAISIYRDKGMSYCLVHSLIERCLFSQFDRLSDIKEIEEICNLQGYASELEYLYAVVIPEITMVIHPLNFP